jgi:fumarate hydratase subunit beta
MPPEEPPGAFEVAVKLTPPLAEADVLGLHAGDRVLISGTIYTARDAAHRKLVTLIEKDEDMPLELEGQLIYYTGPTPASRGRASGAAGPTTSSRMDRFTPALLARGVRAVMGKGERSKEVAAALREFGAVYLAAIGGAGALLAERILKAEVVAYPELGTEAIHRLEVIDFPAIVAIDCHGGDIYIDGRARFRRQI